MSWALDVYAPTGSLLKTITEETSPNPIIGGITAAVDGWGATKQINFRAVQTLLELTPRSIVRFSASPEATPVAAGVVVTCPSLISPGGGPADPDSDALERISAVGLEQLLRDSMISVRWFNVEADAAVIALDLCELYAHPALVIDPVNFPATGSILPGFYAPEMPLFDALAELVKTVTGGARYWVDADRAVHFQATGDPEPVEIPYSRVEEHSLLPIDAEDVVTKVRLVVAGNHAGAEPKWLTSYATDDSLTIDTVDYFASPIQHIYEAPEHATFGSERAFALEEGVNPFHQPQNALVPEPDSVIGFTNPGSPSAIRDGDPATYADLVNAGGIIEYPFTEDVVGFRLKYTLSGTPTIGTNRVAISLSPRASGARSYGRVSAGIELAESVDPTEVEMVLPPHANWALENGAVEAPHAGIFGSVGLYAADVTLRVFDFYPLRLNRPLLEAIAKADVRLPASAPRRVTVSGFVAPGRVHTLVGWPGGDYSAQVSQYQYQGGQTVIDFEQTGPPIGVEAELMEAERARRTAVRGEIRRAGYGLMMGERQ